MGDSSESGEPLGGLGGLWPRTLGVFAAAFAYLRWLQFQTPIIPGFDGYYHIKFAELLPSMGFAREFKWAAHSVWATHFADKEILFHIFLVPFTWFEDLAVGAKYATVLLGAVAVTTFYLILHLNRLRFPLVWTLLLTGSGGYFLYRLALPRPQLVSIILLLWSVHLILNRRRVALAVVTVIYSLSYTAFHLPLALALIAGAYLFLTEREVDWKTPLTILGAMALGMLVNPYFPNNVWLFWVQNFGVPWMAVGGKADLNLAVELGSLSTRVFLLSHLSIVVPYLLAIYLSLTRPRTVGTKTRILFLFSTFFLLMTFMIRRFMEYSVPITLLFLAAYYTEQLSRFDLRAVLREAGRRRRWVVAALAALAVALAGLQVRTWYHVMPNFGPGPATRQDAALYLKEHTDPDELVFTCDWDDAPELFYFNDRNRYPVMLDPNFMYYRDPELWREWYEVARGGYAGRTYDILARDYRFGVCTWDFDELKRIVEKDPRMEVVHDDDWAWVFRIDRDNPEITLDQFLELAPDR
jgi:hypothetical protein